MKPRLLELCAFGPFPGHVQVDFRKLQGQDLVLIEGPTGAGKTTLLDAMCFALFGELPGARAQAKSPELRCTHAQAELCQVSFDFELAGKGYRARRVPAQERPAKRGDGLVAQVAQAFLYLLEGEQEHTLLASGDKKVTAHVEGLLGLSVAQFKQVLLLPQGEFRQFLLASSEEKERLLKRLFKTTVYEEVESELSAQRRELEEGARGAQSRRAVELQRCGVETLEALEARMEALGAELAEREQQAQGAEAARAQAEEARARGQQLAAAFEAQARALAERARLQARLPGAEATRERLGQAERAKALLAPLALRDAEAKRTEALRARREAAEQALRAAEREREAVAQQMRSLPEDQAKLARLVTSHSVLAGLVDTEREAAAARGASREAEARGAAARAALAAAQAQAQRLGAELQALEAQLAAAQAASAGAAERTSALKEAEGRAKERRQLEELRTRIKALKAAVRGAEEALRRAQEEAQAADAALAAARAAREAGLAAELAAGLTPGHPCPVCGGTEHPAPALPAEGAAGLEAVQAAEAAAQRAQQRLSEALSVLARERASTEVTLEQGKALGSALGPLAEVALTEVERLAQERAAEARSAQEASEALLRLVPRREQLAAARAAAEGALAQARDAETRAAREAEAARHHLEELQRRLEEHLLPGHSVASQRAELEREQVVLSTAIAEREARDRRAAEALAVGRAALEGAQRDEREQALRLREQDEGLEREARAHGFADVAELRRASLPPEDEARLRAELEALERALAAAEQAVRDCAAALEGQQPPQLAALAAAAQGAAAAVQQALGAREAARAQLAQLREARGRIGEQEASYAALEARLRVLGRLAEMVAGQNALKMSLQTFVLASRMDEVAVAASERLLRMSRGRYALQRTNDVKHRGKQSGLELKVLDRHAGIERYVHSLSGGEMFLASLSLALGLADVVTRRSGGVQLDALFIDEGFGTLDDETLDQVMRTLEDLRAGGRMVGLISHVSELKERIPTRLTVSKGPRGSTVSLRA